MSPLVEASKRAGTALSEGDKQKFADAVKAIAANGGKGGESVPMSQLGTGTKPRDTPTVQQTNDNQSSNGSNARGRQQDAQRQLGYGR
jgi:hypothetical protein